MNSIQNIDTPIIIYQNGEIELKIHFEEDTIWLSGDKIGLLFDVQRPAIVKHISNIYKAEELDKNLTCSILEQVAKDGKSRKVNYYNLDIIIAVGYRVNSKKATHFRIWSTSILKNYIHNGYTINSDKITHQRFKELEIDVNNLKHKVSNIDKLIDSNQINIKEGIFFDGQIFDAYVFINNLLKESRQEVVLIDNYIDESVLTLFSKYENINFTIVTKSISKQLKLDIGKYSSQYNNLTIKVSNKFHDRFLLIDNNEAYHIGASLKDLGKKVFAFSKMDIDFIRGLI